MRYDAKDATTTIPAGEYAGELVGAEEKQSKTGNDMMVLRWRVPTATGNHTLFDRIVAINNYALARYKKLATAFGCSKEFENNQFDATQHVGKVVTIKVTVKDDPQFGEQNNITDYIGGDIDPAVEAQLAAAKQAEAAEADPEIPF